MTIVPTISAVPAKKVAVISHERSGTHFLMNTIAGNFGYVSDPWWNLDFTEPVNFHSPDDIERYFRRTHDKSILNILKSHHAAGFFEDIAAYFARQFQVFYILRDPRDTLISHWRLIRSLDWDEGPTPKTAGEFIRAAPRGALMRYQKQQERNMLSRWRTHVEGWLDLAEANPAYGVCVLSYEELSEQFEETVRSIGNVLGRDANVIRRPRVDENVVGEGRGRVGGYRTVLSETDLNFATSELRPVLDRLGYDV